MHFLGSRVFCQKKSLPAHLNTPFESYCCFYSEYCLDYAMLCCIISHTDKAGILVYWITQMVLLWKKEGKKF